MRPAALQRDAAALGPALGAAAAAAGHAVGAAGRASRGTLGGREGWEGMKSWGNNGNHIQIWGNMNNILGILGLHDIGYSGVSYANVECNDKQLQNQLAETWGDNGWSRVAHTHTYIHIYIYIYIHNMGYNLRYDVGR